MKLLPPQHIGNPPLPLANAKRQCFVTSTADDAYIEGLISAAIQYAENRTWRAIHHALYKAALPGFPDNGEPIELPKPPLVKVEELTYTDSEGNQVTMEENTDYEVDQYSTPALIYPKSGRWPQTKKDAVNPVKIEFEAGYDGQTHKAPGDILQALKMLVKHWYDEPSAVLVGSISKQVEFSVGALLDPHSARVFV